VPSSAQPTTAGHAAQRLREGEPRGAEFARARLQSVFTDQDSLVIGYNKTGGEPRGKARPGGQAQERYRRKPRAACVDCGRCVVVCPTSGPILRPAQTVTS